MAADSNVEIACRTFTAALRGRFREDKVVEIVHYPNADDALAAAGL